MYGFASKKVVVEDPPSYSAAVRASETLLELVAPIKDVYIPSAVAYAKPFLAGAVEHRVYVFSSLFLLVTLLLCLDRRTSSSDNGKGEQAADKLVSGDVTEHTLELTASSSTSSTSRDYLDSDGGDDHSVEETYDAFLTKLGFEEKVPKVALSEDAKDALPFDLIDRASSDSEDSSLVTFEDKLSGDAPATQNAAALEETVVEGAPATQDAATLEDKVLEDAPVTQSLATPEETVLEDAHANQGAFVMEEQALEGAPATPDAATLEEKVSGDAPATQDASVLENLSSSFDEVFDTSTTFQQDKLDAVAFVLEEQALEDAPATPDAATLEEKVSEDAPATQDVSVLENPSSSFDEVFDTSTTFQQDKLDAVALEKPTSSPPALRGAVTSTPGEASVKKQFSSRRKRKSIKRNLSKIFNK